MKATDSLSLSALSLDVERADRIRRFTKTERFMHWSFALPQIFLMITGGWMLAFASGSGESAVKIDMVTAHKVAAACFVLAPFLVFMSGNTRTLVENIKLALSWNRNDLLWFYHSFVKVFVPSMEVPDAGKFNSGQKLNMLIVMFLGATFVASGLFMWFRDGVLLAWIVHAASFLIAMFIVLGHVYMAILHSATRPSFWAIIDGHVDREWAIHHHAEWIKELDKSNIDANRHP